MGVSGLTSAIRLQKASKDTRKPQRASKGYGRRFLFPRTLQNATEGIRIPRRLQNASEGLERLIRNQNALQDFRMLQKNAEYLRAPQNAPEGFNRKRQNASRAVRMQ